MKYDFSKKYQIIVKGTPEEIKDWLKEISLFMDKGKTYSMLEDRINDLERSVNYEEMPFGAHHLVYFKNGELRYVPFAAKEGAKEIHFKAFKILFDEAKIKMDEKYSSGKSEK
jgi:hypothetical protein